jgi:hypothetical protein
MKPASNLTRVCRAICIIATRRSLGGQPTSHHNKLGIVEGVAHELAHRLEMGRGWERRLDGVCHETANRHEGSVLRIEVVALSKLSVRVSLRKLWRDAAWRGERPRLVERALTARERKCVATFVRIVRGAMG